MEDYFETFRLNVKFYREQKKMSQSQLAIGADCTNGLIGQIEAGTTKPSFDRIVNIAAALQVHPADLFLRNASTTVSDTKSIIRKELIPQIEEFVERRL
ncbi:MAG: helix-turn-helix transcriptional regulator [Treponema sp.]|uniref:helix-turn-helix domain-containing protein n=1 Tax=Treponema sp. TaxID=166 RepID=UPI0025F66EB3|nr:helix-turn-helix transcriptional regulator [Treponema sp.]MBQ8680295.1 helix-turn-helix transcriptional regulator [Treponema sp.]